MSYLPARPYRDPLVAFNRPSDGSLVEVWTTSHTLRSRDRQVAGSTYHRALLAVDGNIISHLPARRATPDAALDLVRALFPTVEAL